MKNHKKDSVTGIVVIVFALVLIGLLAAIGCTTNDNVVKQLCGSAEAKQGITRLLLAEGLEVNNFYEGYMVDKAELGEYNYVAEGASICWISLKATTTKLTEYQKTRYGYTYAVWSGVGKVTVRDISIKYL